MKVKIKSGDEVVILSGNERGTRAKVLQVMPSANRILIEGVNMRKHFKKSRNPDQAQQEEGPTERENPIHLSNVMLASRYDERRARRESASEAPAQAANS